MRILLVEDDEATLRVLQKLLSEQHYVVDTAMDGKAGWDLLEAFSYDLILLDIILPGLDGIRFCQQLRTKDFQTPVLLLTVQNSCADKVLGLDAGADDYMVKPFEVSELLARIRALLRRKKTSDVTILEWLDLRLDPGICEVTYNGQVLNLTPKEYRLLELFLRNHHRVFNRGAILDHLWSYEEAPREDTITAHIKALRQKLKAVGAPTDLIETVYGQGYRLKQLKSLQESFQSLPNTQEAIHEQTKSRLAKVWKKYQGLSRDRLSTLEKLVTIWLEKGLDEEQQQEGKHAAHKLAGALGVFGFAEGSELARKLEKTFQTCEKLSPSKARYLFGVLAALGKLIEQPIAKIQSPEGSLASSKSARQRPLLVIVDNNIILTEQLVQLAERWGISVESTSNLATVKAALNSQAAIASVVLLNFSLADATAADLLELAQLVNHTPPIPVLLLTDHDNLLNRVKLAHLPAHVFLQASLSPEQIWATIARVRSQLQATAAKVMVVDDDPTLLVGMRSMLEPLGLKLTTLDHPLQFWHLLQEVLPDLLILDVKMPDLNGIELCQVLRTTPQWSQIPVLFLTAHTDSCTVNQVFAAGADDCIGKDVGSPEIVTRILNRLEQTRLLQGVANVVSH